MGALGLLAALLLGGCSLVQRLRSNVVDFHGIPGEPRSVAQVLAETAGPGATVQEQLLQTALAVALSRQEISRTGVVFDLAQVGVAGEPVHIVALPGRVAKACSELKRGAEAAVWGKPLISPNLVIATRCGN